MRNSFKFILSTSISLFVIAALVLIISISNNRNNSSAPANTVAANISSPLLTGTNAPLMIANPSATTVTDSNKQQTTAEIDATLNDLKMEDLSNDDFQDFGTID